MSPRSSYTEDENNAELYLNLVNAHVDVLGSGRILFRSSRGRFGSTGWSGIVERCSIAVKLTDFCIYPACHRVRIYGTRVFQSTDFRRLARDVQPAYVDCFGGADAVHVFYVGRAARVLIN